MTVITYLYVTDCVEVLFIKTVNENYRDFITFQQSDEVLFSLKNKDRKCVRTEFYQIVFSVPPPVIFPETARKTYMYSLNAVSPLFKKILFQSNLDLDRITQMSIY